MSAWLVEAGEILKYTKANTIPLMSSDKDSVGSYALVAAPGGSNMRFFTHVHKSRRN